MSTENTTEEPKKKTIEELILSKPITPEIVNKLFDVYKDEWNKYSDMMTKLLDQSILNDIQDIKVLVDRIDTQPSSEDQFDIKDKLLNDEKKKIFCMWLFKSHILCVNADERIVGRKIEHDLPVMFKIYLNKNLANRINNISNTTVKIEQYNKAVEKILDQFKTYFNDSDFFFKRIDAATTESNLDSVQICLGFNTYYSEAEHGYIKEFVKEVVTDENKSKESLEQSEEGIGGILLIILAMPWLLAIPLIIIMIIKNKFDNIKDKKDLKEFYKENKKLADELSNVLKNKLKIGNSLKTISTVLRDNCKLEYNYHDIMYDNFSEGYNLNDKDIEDIDNDIGNGILKQIVKTMKNKKTFDKTDLLNIFSDISVNLFVSLIPLKIDNKKDLVNYGSKESPSSAYSNDFIKNTLNKFDKILENIKNKSNIHNLKQIKDTNPRKDLMTYLSEDEDYESSLTSDGKNGFSIRIDCNIDFDFSDIVKDINLSSNDKSEESLDQSSELFGHNKKKEEPKQKPVKLSKENALKACKNCAKLLKDAFAKNGNPKGFSIYSESEIKENIDEYLDEDNDSNSVIIGGYDAWEFTNNRARDEKEYKKFDNTLVKVENTIKDLMKQSNCPYNISSDGGDWDDGYYTVYFTQKPNLEHEKSYMGSEESLDQSEEGFFNGRFFKKDKLESNGFLQYKSRPTWMKDFVTSSNKLFCSHFKELENYVAYKGYKIATKNDVTNLPHNFLKCKDHYSPDYECDKTIGKFIFSCCSYNNSGSAHLYVVNSKNKIETIKYIGGVLTKKTALQQTIIIT